MTPALFIIVSDATFAGISDPQIQGSVSRNGFTHYITGNLTPPGGTLYIMRSLANGGFISNQSKQPAYATATDTFFGWPVPA